MKRFHPTHTQIVFAIASVMFLLLTACGGGGSSSGGNGGTGGTTPTGSTPAAAIASGQIQGFGSIIVNGVRYETDSSEFDIENENSGSIDDLEVGMQVTVIGSVNSDGRTGTADRVRFDDDLEGPITNVATSNTGSTKTITVLGQMVLVESGVTFFDNNDPAFTFASLGAGSVGQVVEVSGFDLPDGSIQATFIEKKADNLAAFLAAGQELEIKGNISNLDAANFTFQIGAQVIDYSTAALFDLDNAPNNALENGLPVEVKSTDTDLSDGVMTASIVEVKLPGLRRGQGRDDFAKAEVEGFIAQLNTGAMTFMLNGQMVNYANAAFRGGLEDELANGIKVEAEGPFSNGVLNATRVTFKESIKFEANVDTVNTTNGTLTLQGLPGITITADSASTRFDDATGLDDLAPGNNLRVRARPSGAGGEMKAVRITFRDENPDDRVIAQGLVDNFNAPNSVSLLNGRVVVDTTTIQNDEFEIENQIVGRDAFFTALAVGDIVKARARLNSQTGDAKTWEAIEIELEDNN